MFEPIKIPVTLSPHYGDKGPKGFYILAQRLWPGGAPILNKQQWVGFFGSLIVTVQHPGKWDTLLKMGIYAGNLEDRNVQWLDKGSLYPMSMGFRMYIPGRLLKPKSRDRIETIGIFRKCREIYYLEVPKLSAEVLLGRQVLE